MVVVSNEGHEFDLSVPNSSGYFARGDTNVFTGPSTC
jgi:hypothetical protein